MDGAELVNALAAGLAAVWYALYTAVLIWLFRRYTRFTLDCARQLAAACRRRGWRHTAEALQLSLAVIGRTALVVCLLPLVLIIVPVFMGIGALVLTSHLVNVHH